MSPPHPLNELCCVARATLFHLCVDQDDLRALGYLPAAEASEFSPAVLGRARLHHAIRHDDDALAALCDRLDLQFLDTVMHVRDLDVPDLLALGRAWTARPDGRALPALLWALCTDAREQAQAIGAHLCHEALAVAADTLVGRLVHEA